MEHEAGPLGPVNQPTLTDGEILAGIQSRRESILSAWDAVEAEAMRLLCEAGYNAASVGFRAQVDNYTRFITGIEWTDAVDGSSQWMDEGELPDNLWEAWDELGLDDLSYLIPPGSRFIRRENLDYCDHDLAMMAYCEEDALGYFLPEESPNYLRYLEISDPVDTSGELLPPRTDEQHSESHRSNDGAVTLATKQRQEAAAETSSESDDERRMEQLREQAARDKQAELQRSRELLGLTSDEPVSRRGLDALLAADPQDDGRRRRLWRAYWVLTAPDL